MAVDMGAATALESWLLRIFSDNCQLLLFAKWKDMVFIFQKHQCFSGNLSCQLMVSIPVKNRAFLSAFLCSVNDI